MLDTEAGELVGICGRENHVALDLGVHNLAHNVLLGDAHNKTVFGRVVLVLCLHAEAFAGVVVGLSLSAAAVLCLVAFEVGLVLVELDEWHWKKVSWG